MYEMRITRTHTSKCTCGVVNLFDDKAVEDNLGDGGGVEARLVIELVDPPKLLLHLRHQLPLGHPATFGPDPEEAPVTFRRNRQQACKCSSAPGKLVCEGRRRLGFGICEGPLLRRAASTI